MPLVYSNRFTDSMALYLGTVVYTIDIIGQILPPIWDVIERWHLIIATFSISTRVIHAS